MNINCDFLSHCIYHLFILENKDAVGSSAGNLSLLNGKDKDALLCSGQDGTIINVH